MSRLIAFFVIKTASYEAADFKATPTAIEKENLFIIKPPVRKAFKNLSITNKKFKIRV